MFGEKIRAELSALRDNGIKIEEKETKKGKIYSFGDSNCSVEVKIEEKWLGVEFKLRHSGFWYAIDTDLYDITQERNKKFAQDIENEIALFLSNLSNGKILFSDGSLFVIPTLTGYVIATPSSRSTYDKPLDEIAEAHGRDFQPFALSHETL
jgi:hypothetical protein